MAGALSPQLCPASRRTCESVTELRSTSDHSRWSGSVTGTSSDHPRTAVSFRRQLCARAPAGAHEVVIRFREFSEKFWHRRYAPDESDGAAQRQGETPVASRRRTDSKPEGPACGEGAGGRMSLTARRSAAFKRRRRRQPLASAGARSLPE